MPVILASENSSEWLAGETPVDRPREFLAPFPAELMEAYRVSSYASKATNKGPECIEPLC